MALTPEVKKEIVAKYGTSATDTGSPEAQVALLSKRIEDITTHLKTNPHDHDGCGDHEGWSASSYLAVPCKDRYCALQSDYRKTRYSPLI